MQDLAVQEVVKDTVQQAQQEQQAKDLMAVAGEDQVQTDTQQVAEVAQGDLAKIGQQLSQAMAA
jgi:hypothetical protein